MAVASARPSGAGPKTVARMRQDEARIWEDLGSSGEALGVPVASGRTAGAGALRGSWEEWRRADGLAVYHRTREGVCLKQTPSRPPSPGAAMLYMRADGESKHAQTQTIMQTS